MSKKFQKGFTLIEALVVVLILAVVVGIGTPIVANVLKDSSTEEFVSNAKLLEDSVSMYYRDNGVMPSKESAQSDDIDEMSRKIMLSVLVEEGVPQPESVLDKLIADGKLKYIDYDKLKEYTKISESDEGAKYFVLVDIVEEDELDESYGVYENDLAEYVFSTESRDKSTGVVYSGAHSITKEEGKKLNDKIKELNEVDNSIFKKGMNPFGFKLVKFIDNKDGTVDLQVTWTNRIVDNNNNLETFKGYTGVDFLVTCNVCGNGSEVTYDLNKSDSYKVNGATVEQKGNNFIMTIEKVPAGKLVMSMKYDKVFYAGKDTGKTTKVGYLNGSPSSDYEKDLNPDEIILEDGTVCWDVNGDGKADVCDTDGDGKADSLYPPVKGLEPGNPGGYDPGSWEDMDTSGPPTIDTDGDGIPDAWDTDGDGKPDVWDTDGDGLPDAWDLDGDGKPDAWDKDEPKNGKPDTWDRDGDGKPDAWDKNPPYDGKPDSWDLDGDGKPDVFDNDGDGYPDGGTDTNGDGKPDAWDLDGDGEDDAWDFDGDGVPDVFDRNPKDGLPDGEDTNGDGKPDAWDTDGDGQPDVWDTDGDGKPDAWDRDKDGRPDAWDTDGDGLPDAWDTDGDGLPDAWDTDGDGIPDAWDTSVPRDGKPDIFDTDGDGVPDTSDKDGDGLPDTKTDEGEDNGIDLEEEIINKGEEEGYPVCDTCGIDEIMTEFPINELYKTRQEVTSFGSNSVEAVFEGLKVKNLAIGDYLVLKEYKKSGNVYLIDSNRIRLFKLTAKDILIPKNPYLQPDFQKNVKSDYIYVIEAYNPKLVNNSGATSALNAVEILYE